MILRSPPSDVAEEDLLAGLELIHRDTHGRYSLSDRVALKAQATWGGVTGVARRLTLTPAEVLTWKYEPRYHLRPAQQRPDAFFKAGGEALFPFWRKEVLNRSRASRPSSAQGILKRDGLHTGRAARSKGRPQRQNELLPLRMRAPAQVRPEGALCAACHLRQIREETECELPGQDLPQAGAVGSCAMPRGTGESLEEVTHPAPPSFSEVLAVTWAHFFPLVM